MGSSGRGYPGGSSPAQAHAFCRQQAPEIAPDHGLKLVLILALDQGLGQGLDKALNQALVEAFGQGGVEAQVQAGIKALGKGAGLSLINGLGLGLGLCDRQVADPRLPHLTNPHAFSGMECSLQRLLIFSSVFWDVFRSVFSDVFCGTNVAEFENESEPDSADRFVTDFVVGSVDGYAAVFARPYDTPPTA